MSTPIERLDDAVAEFLKDIEEGGSLSGYALTWQTIQLSGDGENISIAGYHSDQTMGTMTSPELAVGLLELATARVKNFLVGYPENDATD